VHGVHGVSGVLKPRELVRHAVLTAKTPTRDLPSIPFSAQEHHEVASSALFAAASCHSGNIFAKDNEHAKEEMAVPNRGSRRCADL
jgi:hypothetical protein